MKKKSESKVWGKKKRGEPRPKKNSKGFYLDATFAEAVNATLKDKK